MEPGFTKSCGHAWGQQRADAWRRTAGGDAAARLLRQAVQNSAQSTAASRPAARPTCRRLHSAQANSRKLQEVGYHVGQGGQAAKAKRATRVALQLGMRKGAPAHTHVHVPSPGASLPTPLPSHLMPIRVSLGAQKVLLPASNQYTLAALPPRPLLCSSSCKGRRCGILARGREARLICEVAEIH